MTLDDIPRKLCRNHTAVLAALRVNPRFSVFAVDDALAKTLGELTDQRRLRHLNHLERYPVCRVEVLPPTRPCPICETRGGVATGLPGRWKYRVCGACGGSGYVPLDSPELEPVAAPQQEQPAE